MTCYDVVKGLPLGVSTLEGCPWQGCTPCLSQAGLTADKPRVKAIV